MVRTEMTRQLRRVDAGERDRALRKALERRRRVSTTQGANANAPLPWWRPTDAAAHSAWIAAPSPEPVRYEDLTPTSRWQSGQPVTLITQGHAHTCWVRLNGVHVGPRWLYGDLPRRVVAPAELTFSDPCVVWRDAWLLQLALALLSAEHDERCSWLLHPDSANEPELAELLVLAQEELTRRPSLPFLPTRGSAPSAPPHRRGWLRHEVEAMDRLAQDAIEPLVAAGP